MWKYGQGGYFCLIYVEPEHKVMNITELVQLTLNTWFGYFEYAS